MCVQSTHVYIYARRRDEILTDCFLSFTYYFHLKKQSQIFKSTIHIESEVYRPSIQGTFCFTSHFFIIILTNRNSSEIPIWAAGATRLRPHSELLIGAQLNFLRLCRTQQEAAKLCHHHGDQLLVDYFLRQGSAAFLRPPMMMENPLAKGSSAIIMEIGC